MAPSASAYELEALPELEAEFETGFETEGESEQFFNVLRQLAGRAGSWAAHQATTPGSPLRRVALGAAHSVLRNAPDIFGGLGRGLGASNPRWAALGGALGNAFGHAVEGLDPLVPQSEGEAELEGEISPVRKWYPDAMLEHLGHAAANAEGESEAEALIGAMIPLAARLAPRARPAIMRAAPGLVCGAAGAVQRLRRNPQTRPLVRLMPAIMRRTALNIARQTANGNRISPRQAVRTLARETYRMISSPQRASQAFRRSHALDQRIHRTQGSTSRCRCNCCGTRAR